MEGLFAGDRIRNVRCTMRLCDLTGQRFGKLLVTGREGATPSGYALWRCRCDCGNEIVVESRRLRRGSIKDCGCGGKC